MRTSPLGRLRSARPEGDDTRRQHLLRLVRTLWPEPATISLLRGWGRWSPTSSRFVVLPSSNNPILMVPQRPRRVAAGAIASYQASMSGRKKLVVRILSTAAGFGLADLLPDKVIVSGQVESLEAYLGEQLRRDVRMALYIGPPRAVQKPVLQLLTASGDTFAFAKVGVSPLTRALVRREAAALRLVAAADLSTLQPPAVLHHGQWRGHEVLVVSAIPPGGSLEALRRLLPTAVAELATVSGVTTGPLLDSRYWSDITTRVQSLPASSHAALLSASLDRLAAAPSAHVRLAFGSSHGDWAPWNMTAVSAKVCAWDWEHFTEDVPVGFDAIHYDVQTLVVYQGQTPTDALTTVSDASVGLLSADLDASTHALLVCLYVLDLSTRYLEQGEVDLGGTVLSRVGDWLEPVLSTALGRLDA